MKTIEKGNDLPLTDLPLNDLTWRIQSRR